MTQAAAFVLRLWPATGELGLYPPSRQIIVAQGGYESGWGRADASRLGHNHWNLTRIPADHRPVIVGPDTDANGHPITQRFRAYTSDREAVADYLEFIAAPRYSSGRFPDRSALEALRAADVAQFVILLKEGGFFAAKLSDYTAGMAAALATVRSTLAKVACV